MGIWGFIIIWIIFWLVDFQLRYFLFIFILELWEIVKTFVFSQWVIDEAHCLIFFYRALQWLRSRKVYSSASYFQLIHQLYKILKISFKDLLFLNRIMLIKCLILVARLFFNTFRKGSLKYFLYLLFLLFF